MHPLPTYLQQAAMARECGISPATLRDWEVLGIIPRGKRIRGVRLYHTASVLAAIENEGQDGIECLDPISARIKHAANSPAEIRSAD